ncbi:hypothetical protein [Fulvivirga ligni]|uniref:hypothetical protein n=1 Tax=Fulvivirga ligni TaxID=2904246 RepID=UPI001F1B92AA|nr:hypothetical protein [Fulvivirga ligni]UII19932.1 hypothetical protein LVD16_18990 [Fulvivirga ligni]
MIFPKAKKIAKELNWHKTKDGVFGLYKGYFFNIGDGSILSNPQYKYVIANIANLTEAQRSAIQSDLEANKKALKFSNFQMDENAIVFQFLENFKFTKLKTVYALLDHLVGIYKQFGVPEQDHCHNCSANGSLKQYEINGVGTLLCDSCYREMEKSFYDYERERLAEEKNYMTGFLGAIIFSIPGIIVWVLLAVYLDRIASAMAIVIAFLGMKGYAFFKGKHGKITKYLIVISNIVSIILANVATMIALLMKEGLSLGETFYQLQYNEQLKDALYENVGLSFILAFFTWIWLLFALKDQQLSVKPAEKF